MKSKATTESTPQCCRPQLPSKSLPRRQRESAPALIAERSAQSSSWCSGGPGFSCWGSIQHCHQGAPRRYRTRQPAATRCSARRTALCARAASWDQHAAGHQAGTRQHAVGTSVEARPTKPSARKKPSRRCSHSASRRTAPLPALKGVPRLHPFSRTWCAPREHVDERATCEQRNNSL